VTYCPCLLGVNKTPSVYMFFHRLWYKFKGCIFLWTIIPSSTGSKLASQFNVLVLVLVLTTVVSNDVNRFVHCGGITSRIHRV